MGTRGAIWRLAIQQGWRQIRSAKGRSALVAVMVGAPVMLSTALLVVVMSSDVSPVEQYATDIGSAQAIVQYTGPRESTEPSGQEPEAPSPQQRLADLRSIFGAEISYWSSGQVGVVRDGRAMPVMTRDIDTTSPLTRGMYAIESGRAPRTNTEVLINPALARKGLAVGDAVDVSGQMLTVVGIGRPDATKRGGSELSLLRMPVLDEGSQFLVGGREPVSLRKAMDLSLDSWIVIPRSVIEDPSQLDALGLWSGGVDNDRQFWAVTTIVSSSVLIEIVLLAAPAFAVGIRRQRRDLALLAATGAAPRQVLGIVLGQAVVLGLASSVLGALIGLGGALAIVVVGPDVLPVFSSGPADVRWWPIIAMAALGALAALLAALLPAIQISRQQVAMVLAGRRGEVRSRRGWPLAGAVVVTAGVFVCFRFGTSDWNGAYAIAWSTIAVVLGMVMVMPWLVGRIGRLGTPLPLPWRLATRDMARQRSRSAPAVAAIMASVAGITAIAIASTSDFEQSRALYQPSAPMGQTLIDSGNSETLAAAMRLVEDSTGQSMVTIGSPQSADGRGFGLRFSDKGDQLDETTFGGLVMADADTLREWGVELSADQAEALAQGEVLLDQQYLQASSDQPSGTVDIVDDSGAALARNLRYVPADLSWIDGTTVSTSALAVGVISPVAADRYDLPWTETRAVTVGRADPPTKAQQDEWNEQLWAEYPDGYAQVTVERGFDQSFGVALVALYLAGTLAVLIGTWAATALALGDAAPDLSTLVAVGARPATKRWVAGAQATSIALLGALTGIAVGFVPGVASTWPLTANMSGYSDGLATVGVTDGPTIVIPWALLATIAIAVPLLAGVVALIVTRSQATITRRIAQ